jgi:hypothetical protein
MMNKNQKEIEKLQKKRTIIRIWTSEHNSDTEGKSDVGHVSLQITGVAFGGGDLYVSLWQDVNLPFLGQF